jgi:uncharacterized membrane protein
MRLLARALDLLCAIFLAVWILGGIPWGDRWILTHGADPRRAALLVAGSMWMVPWLRERSWILKACFTFWDKLQEARVRWIVLGFLTVWSILLGIFQTYALRYTLYDVGIYHQVIWNLAHGNGFASTLSSTGSYLLDHLSISYILLVPFFWLSGSNPATLAVLHALLAWGGVLAWLWLIEQMDRISPERRNRIAAGVLVFFASFESLWANFRWGFHDTALSFFVQSWAFAIWFGAGKTWRMRALSAALLAVSAFSKEILLLDVGLFFALWGLGFFISNKKPFAVGAGLVSVFLFLGFVAFQSVSSPAKKNYFLRYYSYLGDNLGDFLQTALTRPWVIGQTVGWGALAGYVITLLGPFIAMPLLTKWTYPSSAGAPEIQKVPARLWLLAVLPSVASGALSSWTPHRSAGFHHVFDIWPVVILLSVLFLANIPSKRWILAWTYLSLLTISQDPWGQMREYFNGTRLAGPAREMLARIPNDGWIMADDNVGPWLARRAEINRFPERELFPERCPDYLVFEGRTEEQAQERVAEELADCTGLYSESERDEATQWSVLTKVR